MPRRRGATAQPCLIPCPGPAYRKDEPAPCGGSPGHLNPPHTRPLGRPTSGRLAHVAPGLGSTGPNITIIALPQKIVPRSNPVRQVGGRNRSCANKLAFETDLQIIRTNLVDQLLGGPGTKLVDHAPGASCHIGYCTSMGARSSDHGTPKLGYKVDRGDAFENVGSALRGGRWRR